MQTLFSGWESIGRVALMASLGYVGLLLLLRASGKRTIAKMNVFDFVVTVALGSVLANAILSPEVSVADVMTAFAVLIFLQFVFSILTRRSKRLEQMINGRPTILLQRGHLLDDQLKRQRVTQEEVRAAVRSAGVGKLEDLDAVVLETDRVFTVLREVPQEEQERTTLCDVDGVRARV